jgi:hypothetical protein
LQIIFLALFKETINKLLDQLSISRISGKNMQSGTDIKKAGLSIGYPVCGDQLLSSLHNFKYHLHECNNPGMAATAGGVCREEKARAS